MALFERLSNTLSAAGKDGLNKAKEIKDTAKINVDIREREGSIQRMYRELGRAYYQDHKDDPAPDYSQVFAIKAAFEEIGELKASKDEIRGIKRCANCGKIISVEALFCSGCGTKVEDDTVVFDGDAETADFRETAEEAADKAEEIKEDVKETVEDAAAKAAGFAETGKEVAEDAVQDARERIRDVADKAEDLARDAAQKVEGVAKDIAHRVEEFIDKNAD